MKKNDVEYIYILKQMRVALFLIALVVGSIYLMLPSTVPHRFLLNQYKSYGEYEGFSYTVANITTTDDIACILSKEGTLHCILHYYPEEYRICDKHYGIHASHYSFCVSPYPFHQVMPNVNLVQAAICSHFICGLDTLKHIVCVTRTDVLNGNINGTLIAASEFGLLC